MLLLLLALLPLAAQGADYSFKVSSNSADGRCSDKELTSFTYNTTISSPGAIAVFVCNQPAYDYWKTHTDLTPLASLTNDTAIPVPFPPMSCYNPQNTPQNTTLYTRCDAVMPDGFSFSPAQKMCVLVKNSGTTDLQIDLKAQWDTQKDDTAVKIAQQKSSADALHTLNLVLGAMAIINL